MKYGISTASLYPLPLEKAVDELAKNGISIIEMFINTSSEISQSYLIEMQNRLKANGQTVVAIHPFTSGFEPFMIFGNYPRRLDDGLELHKHYFEAMNILGANIFVFHGDRSAGPISDHEYYERFAMLRDVGKEFGITVAQENVERCKSRSLDFLKNMVSYLDNDISFVFDNKQATRSGIEYSDFIDAVGKHIAHVHISDNNSQCDCLPLGKGDADVLGLLQSIDNTGFDGCVVIELYSELINSLSDIYEGYFKFFSNN